MPGNQWISFDYFFEFGVHMERVRMGEYHVFPRIPVHHDAT